MQIGMIGINHKSADLALRERFARACRECFGRGALWIESLSHLLLSTCNRTEVYFSAEDLSFTHSHFLAMLRREIEGEFTHNLYAYFGFDCFLHLAQVTCGLDSAILGETEIQGQVRTTYEQQRLQRSLSKELHFLFQKSLKIGKEVRTEFSLSQKTPLEETLTKIAGSILEDLSLSSILFIGYSEVNRKICTHLQKLGCRNITFCNRTPLAPLPPFSALAWEQLDQWEHYDFVLCGTSAPEYIIPPPHRSPLATRLIMDLSVPRNVHPALSEHLTLFNIDHIHRAIESSEKSNSQPTLFKPLLIRKVRKHIQLFHAREDSPFALASF